LSGRDDWGTELGSGGAVWGGEHAMKLCESESRGCRPTTRGGRPILSTPGETCRPWSLCGLRVGALAGPPSGPRLVPPFPTSPKHHERQARNTTNNNELTTEHDTLRLPRMNQFPQQSQSPFSVVLTMKLMIILLRNHAEHARACSQERSERIITRL